MYCQEHAREWVTPLVCLETAERLLRKHKNMANYGEPSNEPVDVAFTLDEPATICYTTAGSQPDLSSPTLERVASRGLPCLAVEPQHPGRYPNQVIKPLD